MKKYGVIGYPISHSFSPQIHNTAFEHYKIDASYCKIEIPLTSYEKKFSELKNSTYNGFNITVPYKEKVIPFLDGMDGFANKLKAVNTIKVTEKGEWIGYNTDYQGFLKPIENELSNFNTVLILGAGGAARSVGFAILDRCRLETLYLYNRTEDKAEKVLTEWREYSTAGLKLLSMSTIDSRIFPIDLIVNCTSVGMGSLIEQNSLPNPHLLQNNPLVYDLIYNPGKTKLLEQAEKGRLKTINGLPMLLGQAEESFFIWTGKRFTPEINRAVMKKLKL